MWIWILSVSFTLRARWWCDPSYFPDSLEVPSNISLCRLSLMISRSRLVKSFTVCNPNLPHCRRGLANPDYLLNACLGSIRPNADLVSAQPVSLFPKLSEALSGQASTDCLNWRCDWLLDIIPVNYPSKRRRQSKHRCATLRTLLSLWIDYKWRSLCNVIM